MSGKYLVTAKLDTVVAVRYKGSGTSHGKWKTAPGGSVGIGTSQIFVATNNDSASAGPEGWASYFAADNTTMKFSYDDPNSTHNDCSSAFEGKVYGNYSLPTPDYPSGGKTWTVTYKIATPSAFFDAPVFPDDVVSAAKCDAYSDERVLGFLGERTCVRMSDVLEHPEVPLIGKLWCATHRLFLTPSSKAALTRDLAMLVAEELGAVRGSMLDEALQLSQDHARVGVSAAHLRHARALFDERARSAHGRAGELWDCLRSLAASDHHDGWSDAASSYIANTLGDEYAARAARLLALVEARL